MKFTARPLSLLVALALGSFALGAVTTSKPSAVPAAPSAAQAFPFGGVDASVPSASTVSFPIDEDAAAPTF